MLNLFIKSFRDFFDKKIFIFSLIPILLSFFVLGLMYFIFFDSISSFFVALINYIPFVSGDLAAKIAQGFVSLILFYQLTIMLSVFLVGIVADGVVGRVNEKYYFLEKKGFGTALGAIGKAISSNTLFIALFILLIPLMFIPVINILVSVFLWSILLRSPMIYDALSSYADKKEFENILSENKMKINLLSFAVAGLSLIPLFGVFLYIIQFLIFVHFSLENLAKSRKSQN